MGVWIIVGVFCSQREQVIFLDNQCYVNFFPSQICYPFSPLSSLALCISLGSQPSKLCDYFPKMPPSASHADEAVPNTSLGECSHSSLRLLEKTILCRVIFMRGGVSPCLTEHISFAENILTFHCEVHRGIQHGICFSVPPIIN